MRYLSIWRPEAHGKAPTRKHMEQMSAFVAESLRAGVLLATEGFGPGSALDMKVRLSKGKHTVTDGPFAETKEIIGGFAVMQVATREEMIDWTRRFLAVAGDGECEIHQLSDESPIDSFRRAMA